MLNNPNENFIVLMMPGNVLAIVEPLHEQCVISFMIIGPEKILLLDTCTGILNLREVVDYFAACPVTVLNSHDHFDHIGSNAQFDDVWCYDLPSAVRHLTNGPTETEQAEILDSTKSVHVLFKHDGYEIPERIPGKAPTGTVKDGQIIDLGGRMLEVIHTPGHQPSCIMLLDRENKLLFTGDMFYPGPMYCMFDDSSFPDYVKSIRKAADLTKELGISKVYTSHNAPASDAETLCRFADFLEGIEKGEITEYETDENGFRNYRMDDVFSICLPGEGTEAVTGYSMPDPE
jgi:glyoxylase-like metal-dependent hydrolase (beta-lactamase superfamily II)